MSENGKSSKRDEMVQTSAIVDSLREVFGKEGIDNQIRKALKHEPGYFYFVENGHKVGTKSEPRSLIKWDQRGIAYDIEMEGAK